jgi:hypothetical protein
MAKIDFYAEPSYTHGYWTVTAESFDPSKPFEVSLFFPGIGEAGVKKGGGVAWIFPVLFYGARAKKAARLSIHAKRCKLDAVQQQKKRLYGDRVRDRRGGSVVSETR